MSTRAPGIRGQLGLPFPLPFPMDERFKTVVIGAGIAGLTTAYNLLRQDPQASLAVFEKSERPGGCMATEQRDGYRFELGPETLQSGKPATDAWLAELGVPVQPAPDGHKRYIVHQGQLVALPSKPQGLLKFSAMTLGGKLRFLREPFRDQQAALNGSLADFIRHRLGPEALEVLVDPFVSGIYAGDPEQLSLPAVFPSLHQMVAEHGSLFRGLRAQAKARKRAGQARKQPNVLRTQNGWGELPRRLAERLGDRLHLNSPVQALRRTAKGWRIELATRSIEAERLILATPAKITAHLLANQVPAIANELSDMTSESMCVVLTAWDRDQIDHPLDGFGYLAPSRERLAHLGTLFSSTLSPTCAPRGQVLLRSFVGGAREPDIMRHDDASLIGRVCSDISPLLKTHGGPQWTHVIRWPEVLPRYDLRHPERVSQIKTALRQTPDLELVGNYLNGVGINSLFEQAALNPKAKS